MRWIFGMLAAGSLILAGATARAQDLNAFGDFPAGITTGSQYGFYPGGYSERYTASPRPGYYPTTSRPTYYTSGYYGGTPGTTAYGPGVNLSSPNAAAYGYSSPYTPGYRYVPGTRANSYYYAQPGTVGRGLFGRRGYR